MLGVGWTEMLVIGVVALIVIGPKELPALMHRLGKFAATIRRMGSDFQREINKTTGLDEIKNLRTSITAPLKATTDAIRKEFNSISPTGVVTPSGVLKPADPKAENVVAEIKAAAGIAPTPTPAEAMKAAVTKVSAAPVMTAAPVAAAVPLKAQPAVKLKAAPTAPVAVADIPPAAKPAAKLKAAKPIASPAPVEAIAPAKKPVPRPAVVKAPAPKPVAPKPAAPAKTAAPAAKLKAKPATAKKS